jgi:hypothetical protein
VTQPVWGLAEHELDSLPLNKRKGRKNGGHPVMREMESWK